MTRHKNRLSASALIVRTLIGAGMVVMLIVLRPTQGF